MTGGGGKSLVIILIRFEFWQCPDYLLLSHGYICSLLGGLDSSKGSYLDCCWQFSWVPEPSVLSLFYSFYSIFLFSFVFLKRVRCWSERSSFMKTQITAHINWTLKSFRSSGSTTLINIISFTISFCRTFQACQTFFSTVGCRYLVPCHMFFIIIQMFVLDYGRRNREFINTSRQANTTLKHWKTHSGSALYWLKPTRFFYYANFVGSKERNDQDSREVKSLICDSCASQECTLPAKTTRIVRYHCWILQEQ